MSHIRHIEGRFKEGKREEAARKIAEERTGFMELFLNQLKEEIVIKS